MFVAREHKTKCLHAPLHLPVRADVFKLQAFGGFDYPLPVEPRDFHDVGSEFVQLKFLRLWGKST